MNNGSSDEIAALRREIRETDRAILALVARRLKTAQRIGDAKRRSGIAVRDYAQEADVLQEARKESARLHMDQSLAEHLMRALIEACAKIQEEARK